jgi:hypothetical protein
MKELKIDLSMIWEAMEDVNREYIEYYLDRDTGEVIVLSEEATEYAEEEKLRDDLPEWMQDEVKVAKDILYNNPDRYINIPEKPSYESYHMMVEYTEGIMDELLKEKLKIALAGKGAFRRFKLVLDDYPDYQQKWFQYKEQRLKAEAIDWLKSIGIEAIE